MAVASMRRGGTTRASASVAACFLGRNAILSCKNGDIVIEDDANIGFNTEIFSASRVRVGKKVLIAGVHLSRRWRSSLRPRRRARARPGRTAAGIDIGDHAWLGAHVVVTDGSKVGRDAIIGAGAVVVGEIPEFAIAVGIPAKVVRDRRETPNAERRTPNS